MKKSNLYNFIAELKDFAEIPAVEAGRLVENEPLDWWEFFTDELDRELLSIAVRLEGEYKKTQENILCSFCCLKKQIKEVRKWQQVRK